MARLIGREIADHVKALGGGAHIGVGELAAVGDREIGSRNFQGDDAHLRIAGRDFRRREVAGSDIVVIPEAQIDHLAARKQLPNLRRKDAEVGARIGRGFRPGVRGENMQHANAEFAVLILLAPDTRRGVHQRRERSVGAAQRPNARELFGIDGSALAHQADGGRNVARFLNGRFTRACPAD